MGTMTAYEQKLEKARVKFEQDTSEHELHVLKDDGLYRHLRCNAKGTYIYGFDIVTWPGFLAIVGDAGDYVFARIEDMFEFFRSDHGSINPQYWGEKLQAPKAGDELTYSPQRFEEKVTEWLAEWCRYYAEDDEQKKEMTAAVSDQLAYAPTTEGEAFEKLRNFVGVRGTHIDAFEWNLRDWDPRFLWCCYAIVWAIKRYDERVPDAPRS